MTELTLEQARRNLLAPRGFLFNYPPDVVMVVNGTPITKSDILANKRTRQVRELENKRRIFSPKIVPCFIWVFDNGPIFPYGGWHLYVKTLKSSWWLRPGRWYFNGDTQAEEVMNLYPLGLLPIWENFELWATTFAEVYQRPSGKRESQGMVIAWAVVSGGQLLEVRKEPNE